MVSKKAKERLEAKKRRRKMMFISILVGLVVAVLVLGFILLRSDQSNNAVTYGESSTDTGGQNVLVPASDISDSKFHHYSYDAGGTAVKYFIVKDGSGTIHTAFDACDVCYTEKKGYSQDGSNARCNNCGKTFSVSDIGIKNSGGGCWPGYLPHTIQGNSIVIRTSDLESGRYYFA